MEKLSSKSIDSSLLFESTSEKLEKKKMNNFRPNTKSNTDGEFKSDKEVFLPTGAEAVNNSMTATLAETPCKIKQFLSD